MEINTIKKPTYYHIILGSMLSLFVQRSQKKDFPTAVGKYKLIAKIKKDNPFHRFAIGFYQYKTKKVFIKTWQGGIKNSSYYSFINEYIISTTLNKIIIN